MFAGAWLSQLIAAQYVEPAVNRQPGFRQELVEQITAFIISSWVFLLGELVNSSFPDSEAFFSNFPLAGDPQIIISSTSQNFEHFSSKF